MYQICMKKKCFFGIPHFCCQLSQHRLWCQDSSCRSGKGPRILSPILFHHLQNLATTPFVGADHFLAFSKVDPWEKCFLSLWEFKSVPRFVSKVRAIMWIQVWASSKTSTTLWRSWIFPWAWPNMMFSTVFSTNQAKKISTAKVKQHLACNKEANGWKQNLLLKLREFKKELSWTTAELYQNRSRTNAATTIISPQKSKETASKTAPKLMNIRQVDGDNWSRSHPKHWRGMPVIRIWKRSTDAMYPMGKLTQLRRPSQRKNEGMRSLLILLRNLFCKTNSSTFWKASESKGIDHTNCRLSFLVAWSRWNLAI